jgi:GNAT superfamily N-acetyltransferase
VSNWAFADLELARRLERTEASANAAFVEARARLLPGSGACWMERAGAYAMFDGVDSPITQTFGLGVFQAPTDDDLDAIERFFAERGAATHHEVSPLGDIALAARLVARGYRPIEFTSVMHRPVRLPVGLLRDEPAEGVSGAVVARPIAPGEELVYGETAARGWRQEAGDDLAGFVRDFASIAAHAIGTQAFVAEIEGRPVGTGSLVLHEGVALFAGASTDPQWRGRGAQAALLSARLDAAAQAGCDLVMMCAAPGSASQRNAERLGFRIAYTRIKWAKDA